MERDTITRIFSDALICDIDFSNWQNSISLIVLADHYKDWSDRIPVLEVVFFGIHDFSFQVPKEHFTRKDKIQLNIDCVEIKGEDPISIKLSSLMESPVISILCEDIYFEELDIRMIDRFYKGWDNHSSGFIRKSVTETIQKNKNCS